jgi:hypothetical protein
MNRPLIRQDFINTSLTVGVTPTPLSQADFQASLDSMVDAFMICVPLVAANSVVLGKSNVSIAPFNGLEIRPGIPIQLSIRNERQLYEIQNPIVEQFCTTPEQIPFAVWDVANIFLIAPAPTNIGILLFFAPYL